MDDLQIKPAGGGQTTSSSANPTTSTVSPATDSNNTAAVAANSNKPLNQRAFNLEQDVEQAQSNQTQPAKFVIPASALQKYPELIELIKSAESMDDQEREYWFNILPIMTAEQIEKLQHILTVEKEQLAALDQEYTETLNDLNQKHQIEWQEFENKEKSKALKTAEAVSASQEKSLEEDLLAKLADV